MLPQIMKEDRGKEKTEDESREQKINAYGPENLNQKKKRSEVRMSLKPQVREF